MFIKLDRSPVHALVQMHIKNIFKKINKIIFKIFKLDITYP